MDFSLKLADVAIIFATIIGPILAVQAQKYLERRREVRDRQVSIFRRLMTTRATSLSPLHVEAINAIPIEFYGSGSKLKNIIRAWKLYMDHHLFTGQAPDGWENRRLDLFIDLMTKIGLYLNYDFSSLEIKNDIYHPTAFVRQEQEGDTIRRGLYSLFKGEFAIPLDIKSIPTDPNILAVNAALQQEALNWFQGRQTVKVATQPDRFATHQSDDPVEQP